MKRKGSRHKQPKLQVKLTYSPVDGERERRHKVVALLLGRDTKLPEKNKKERSPQPRAGKVTQDEKKGPN